MVLLVDSSYNDNVGCRRDVWTNELVAISVMMGVVLIMVVKVKKC